MDDDDDDDEENESGDNDKKGGNQWVYWLNRESPMLYSITEYKFIHVCILGCVYLFKL